MTPMSTIEETTMKRVPHFSSSRCKRCGVCSHFCPVNAIDTCEGMPYLANAEACTSCGLCSDMCPDWAVALEPTPVDGSVPDAAAEETLVGSGNGTGSAESVPASSR